MELQLFRDDWIRWENERGEGQIIPGDLFAPADLALLRKVAHERPGFFTGDPILTTVAKLLQPYTEGGEPDPESVEVTPGWCGRYSAPGYMDCTDWVGPFETKREARAETIRLFGAPKGGE